MLPVCPHAFIFSLLLNLLGKSKLMIKRILSFFPFILFILTALEPGGFATLAVKLTLVE